MRIDAGNTDGKWESQDVRALAYDFSGIVGRTISVDDRRVIALARTLLNRGSMEWSWSVIGGNGLDFSTLNQIRFIHMVMERLGLGHDAR